MQTMWEDFKSLGLFELGLVVCLITIAVNFGAMAIESAQTLPL